LERLAALMGEVFALTISEGAISNILLRAREPLLVAATAIHETVTASPVVCSDETSARVTGKTWWEWVFVGTLAVLHVIRPSRGKAVVQALFGTIQPTVWVSDMLGSQRGHGAEWQVCLAHLLRDARYAVQCGDVAFSAAFKRLLLRAIAIGRRRDTLKDTTLVGFSSGGGATACEAICYRKVKAQLQWHGRRLSASDGPGAPLRLCVVADVLGQSPR
jgi:transposase